jgi:radical SAM superfamily enzyme YgiQ (UPF0313 family)
MVILGDIGPSGFSSTVHRLFRPAIRIRAPAALSLCKSLAARRFKRGSTTPMRKHGDVALVSTYELGHQPFALAVAGAFLERAGFTPSYFDFAVESMEMGETGKLVSAKLVAISVPMHTALRLGVSVLERVREVNPTARVAFFGLYAPLNGDELLRMGADFVLGGECEPLLVQIAEAMARDDHEILARYKQRTALEAERTRLDFPVPSRRSLPQLSGYAKLVERGESRLAGHVEASRGCLHLCRHCPVPPVYRGRFFVLPEDVVLRDIAAQVDHGVTHITFGDPDFLNGPLHGLRILRKMKAAHSTLTFDFTAKVEHLLAHQQLLPEYKALGLSFIVSAVESLSDLVLLRLRKDHTRADVERLFDIMQALAIPLRPSFVAFTPWTTETDFGDVLRFIEAREIVDWIDPIQLAVRLLIPPGSLLLELPEVREFIGPIEPGTFTHAWRHRDPAMDRLYEAVSAKVEADAKVNADAAATFSAIRKLAGLSGEASWVRRSAPRLSEPWFCCAEPTRAQFASLGKGVSVAR